MVARDSARAWLAYSGHVSGALPILRANSRKALPSSVAPAARRSFEAALLLSASEWSASGSSVECGASRGVTDYA
jgi:hypothetical protein